jgi:hypothetical protein
MELGFEPRPPVGRARSRGEARDLLAPVYSWFTEGFDTADLKETKALLDTLTEPAIAADGRIITHRRLNGHILRRLCAVATGRCGASASDRFLI